MPLYRCAISCFNMCCVLTCGVVKACICSKLRSTTSSTLATIPKWNWIRQFTAVSRMARYWVWSVFLQEMEPGALHTHVYGENIYRKCSCWKCTRFWSDSRLHTIFSVIRFLRTERLFSLSNPLTYHIVPGLSRKKWKSGPILGWLPTSNEENEQYNMV